MKQFVKEGTSPEQGSESGWSIAVSVVLVGVFESRGSSSTGPLCCVLPSIWSLRKRRDVAREAATTTRTPGVTFAPTATFVCCCCCCCCCCGRRVFPPSHGALVSSFVSVFFSNFVDAKAVCPRPDSQGLTSYMRSISEVGAAVVVVESRVCASSENVPVVARARF